jgi:hypothetical protein
MHPINENRAIKNYEQYVLYDFIYINNKTVTTKEPMCVFFFSLKSEWVSSSSDGSAFGDCGRTVNSEQREGGYWDEETA